MSSFKDLVDEVRSKLAGYTLRQDRITYLQSAINTSATALTVGGGNNLSKGVIEIDDELIWVDSFDKTTSTLNVAPGFGRGWQKSNPAPHSQYAQVTISPSYPRDVIKRAINDTIKATFPKLWAVSSTTFTYNGAQNTYPLPQDAQNVITASWQKIGPSKEWEVIRRFRVDPMANATAIGTNNSITINEPLVPGRTVQVWYTTKPNTLESNDDDFSNITGLPDSAEDVIVLGACYRLLSFIDAGRLNLTSAQADLNDTKTPSTTGTSISKFVYAMYQQRLQEEANSLLGQYPSTIQYTN